MPNKQPFRIVLVDDADGGPTARILESAVSDSNSHCVALREFQVVTMQQVLRTRNFDPQSTVFFVSVPEKDLSVRSNPQAPRVACESLKVAQALIRSDSRIRVLLVQQAGVSEFTAIDVAAAFLAGMSGIVDDRLLIAEGVFDAVLSQQHLDRKSRTMLMLGEPAGRFIRMKEMLEEWENDEQGNDMLDLQCFRAAIALAQLDRLRPLRGPRDHPYSFVMLAQALNLAQSKTSFHINQGDLRKVLSKLTDRLIGSDHDQTERIHLPTYAREKDFPSTPPIIEGLTEKNIPKRLYSLYLATQVERSSSTHHAELWTARLSTTEFRHLTRLK